MSSVPQIIRRRRSRRRAGSAPVLVGGLGVMAVLLVGLLVILGSALAVGAVGYFGVAAVIPTAPQAVVAMGAGSPPTLLLDREGRLILHTVASPTDGDTPWINLADVPEYVWQAALAVTDGAFFDRPGFSPQALIGGLSDALVLGEMSLNDPVLLYLARNVLVPLHDMPLSHPDRLLTDTILMLEMRRRFTREDLLAWYLNTALYGNGAYGIEAAARLYLGKSAAALSLAEAALLAGVPASPAVNPFDQPDAAHRRQLDVLDTMGAYGLVEAEQAQTARVRLSVTRPIAPTDVVAPHYALVARRQAEMVLDEAGFDGPRLVAGGGLRITTALDLDLQYQAECALRTQVTRLSGVDPSFVYATSIGDPCRAAELLPDLASQDVGVPHDVDNGAVVIVRPDTGEVVAYVGSMDYWNESIRGYVDSARQGYQPAAILRPYIYLTALAQGYTSARMTYDVPQEFEQAAGVMYAPANPAGVYRGPISLREALVLNSTTVAAQVMNWVSVPDVIQTAHLMGLNTLLDGSASYDLTLVEQGGDVRLSDLTFSFGVLANGGHMIGARVPHQDEQPGFRALDPVTVLRIEDAEGSLLWAYDPQTRDTLAPELAYLMNDMLSDHELRTEIYGSGSVYDIGRPAAVQAGGSSDGRDLWAVGYTPQYTVGVWMGNHDGAPTSRLVGENGPAAIWHALIRYAHSRDDLPVLDWQRPPGIIELPVCDISGLLPSEHCPTVNEVFAAGTQPVQQDFYWQVVAVNRQTGRRATASTPRDLVEQRRFFIYPEETSAWAAVQGIEGPPTAYDSVGQPSVVGPVAILAPEALDYVRGMVNVNGNATLPGFEYYELRFGQGLNPTNWLLIGERSNNPVRGDLLGRWDTTGLEGLYSLQLTVVLTDQTVEEVVIPVTVDNTPPEVAIASPEPGQELFVSGDNPVLEVGVTYDDNVGVTEVVFYLDGEAATTVIEPPFVGPVVITSLGEHSVWAEAFDAAGNNTLSERVSFMVRRGTPGG